MSHEYDIAERPDGFGGLFVLKVMKALRKSILGNTTQRLPGESVAMISAMKQAINQVVPCAIFEYNDDNITAVWITLGKRLDKWEIKQCDVLPDFIEIRPGLSSYSPQRKTIFFISGKYSDVVFQFFDIVGFIRRILERFYADSIVAKWNKKEKEIFQSVGYRPWKINTISDSQASCAELRCIVSPTRGGQISLDDITSFVNSNLLVRCVPENVFSVLNRSAKLLMWAWGEYEFFTIAQHYATMAIETNLKTLYVKQLDVPVHILLQNTQSHNTTVRILERPETYDDIIHVAYLLSKQDPLTLEIIDRWIIKAVNGSNFPDFKGGLHRIQSILDRSDLLSLNDKRNIMHYTFMRNIHSHPQSTHIDYIGYVEDMFSQIVLLSNRMWLRFLYPDRMLWENEFLKKPLWAQ